MDISFRPHSQPFNIYWLPPCSYCGDQIEWEYDQINDDWEVWSMYLKWTCSSFCYRRKKRQDEGRTDYIGYP